MVLTLDLALVPTTTEDRPDYLLTRGVVHGNVEQVVGGTGLHTVELVDQRLVGCPRELCADDIHVDEFRKGVALLREPTDVIP